MTNHTERHLVRSAQEGDFAEWLPLWEAYQRFYEVDLPESVTRETWRRFFDPHEPVRAAVAVAEGRLVGMTTLVFHRSTWARNDFCYLEDLFVEPSVRSGGVGKALIEWVRERAKERGCDRLYWHTQESNKRAQKLYDWVAERPGVIEYRMPL
jgi:GNAT superfamily N-acetyltransferase